MLAGPPAVAHAEALLRGIELRGTTLDAPLDALVLGHPGTTPFLPRRAAEPARRRARSGSGTRLALWRDTFPVADGGVVILVDRFRAPSRGRRQTPYLAFFRQTPIARNAELLAEAERVAADRRSRSTAPVAPSTRCCRSATGTRAGRRSSELGAVYVAGARDAAAARQLGFIPIGSVGAALQMALGQRGPERAHRLPSRAAVLPAQGRRLRSTRAAAPPPTMSRRGGGGTGRRDGLKIRLALGECGFDSHLPHAMRPSLERHVVDFLAGEGNTASEIARRTGIPRTTVRDWLRLPIFVEPTRLADVPTPPAAEYAYLLGMYLGDGYISHDRRCHRLRIATDAVYPAIIAECARAMQAVVPQNRVAVRRRKDGSRTVDVSAYSKAWPSLFPQHGAGRKHERRIALADWQQRIVEDEPEMFLRGLIHSDGCRVSTASAGGPTRGTSSASDRRTSARSLPGVPPARRDGFDCGPKSGSDRTARGRRVCRRLRRAKGVNS